MRKFLYMSALTVLMIGCSRRPSAQSSSPQPLPDPQSQAQAQPPAQQQAQPVPGQPAPVQPAEIVIPGGTSIQVRLNQELDTKRNRSGDRFTATLVTPIVENNQVIVAQGTQFNGHITAAHPSGRMKGRASLGVTLDSFEVNGRAYPLVTTSTGRSSAKHKKRNLVLIGGGAGTGAVIGAIAAGGKGALIGGGAGAGAGLIGAAITGKKQVSLPAESLLTFRLQEDVEVSE